jgi:hypothetical protein
MIFSACVILISENLKIGNTDVHAKFVHINVLVHRWKRDGEDIQSSTQEPS